MEEKLSIFQWNCRSIFSNKACFTQYISKTQHHVLTLQSLNVSCNKLPKLGGYYFPPIVNYESLQNNVKVSTAIYIRDDLEYSVCKSPISVNTDNVFSVAVKVRINKNLSINVISVYYPAAPSNTNSEWLRSINVSDNWIVTGDFNAHSPFWDNGRNDVTNNRFIENIVDSGLVLLNDGRVTRLPDNPSHRASAIDLTLVSPKLAVDSIWDVESDSLGSDHLPITLTINENPEVQTEEDQIPKYNYDRADWETFQNLLLTCDFDSMNNSDINYVYKNFIETVHWAAKKSIPVKRSLKTRKHKGNVWWNKACEEAVEKKKTTYKKWIKKRSLSTHRDMNEAKLSCNKAIALAQKQYLEDFCCKQIHSSSDANNMWKKVSEMKNGYRLPSCPIKIPDTEFPAPKDKAEHFANIFAKASQSRSLPDDVYKKRKLLENTEDYADPTSDNSLFLNADISMEELKGAIKELGTKKTAVGLDGISYTLLNHLPDKWFVHFHSIILKVWKTNMLPDIWKMSIVVPILKQGKPRSEASSYRPISLTSHSGKILEKIVLNRLQYFCDKNKIIPVNQAGFQKGRSTTDHLVKLTTHIKQQFAKRKNVLATFFDIQKAYDSVWHARLLFKLKSVGMSGNIYSYIKSFLSNRRLIAKVGNSYSSSHPVDMGIPQGSIVSPLLFNILIHDLPKYIHKSVNLVQYADDLAIWLNVSLKSRTSLFEIKNVQKLYQSYLSDIQEYMKMNGLTLSQEKNKYDSI